MKNSLLSSCCLFVIAIIIFSCARENLSAVEKIDVENARSWLQQSGERYARESFKVSLPDGSAPVVSLNWDLARSIVWKGKKFIDIPYQVPATGQKLFSLVLQDEGHHQYKGALRVDQATPAAAILGTDAVTAFTTQTYMHLNGTAANIWAKNGLQHAFTAATYELVTAAEAAAKDAVLRAQYKDKHETAARSATGDPCKVVKETYQTLELCGTVSADPEQLQGLCFVTHTRLVLQCDKTDELISEPEFPPVKEGGGGGNGNTNNSADSTKPKNPCDSIKAQNAIADSLINLLNVQSKKALLTATVATDTLEKAFIFGRHKTNNTNNTYGSGSITLGARYQTAPFSATDPSYYIEGVWHTHTYEGYNASSPGDIYSLNGANNANPYFKYFINTGADGSTYMLTIIDAAAFNTFVSNYPQSTNFDTTNQGWLENTLIGTDYEYFYKMAKREGYDKDKAYEIAQALVIKEYNMGISISKLGADGKFKPLYINLEETGSAAYPLKPAQTTNCNY